MNVFAQLGTFFDKLPFTHWNHRFLDFPPLLKGAKIPKAATVLEVGCGSGRNSLFLAKKLRCKNYIATDKNPAAITQAEARNEGKSKVIFQVADVGNLPFDKDSFDAVICVELLHHVPDWKKAIREMGRVLKKNGRLLLKEFSIETFTLPGVGLLVQNIVKHPYNHMFDQIELLTYIRKSGLHITFQNDSVFSLQVVAIKKS